MINIIPEEIEFKVEYIKEKDAYLASATYGEYMGCDYCDKEDSLQALSRSAIMLEHMLLDKR